VFDLGDIDGLLGLNWFRATGAGLYPAQQLLKFGETSIKLNRCHAQNDMDDEIEEDNMVHADDPDLFPINFEIFSDSSDCIISETHLTPQEDVIFHELTQFIEASQVFAYNFNDIEGCSLLPHTIQTSSDKPIFIPRYRRSNYENDLITTEVKLILDANIIQPSNSLYKSFVELVPKPDGSKRVCIDYRKLNAITVPDHFPMPRIEDNLDSLSGSVFFTILDLFSGYFQTFIQQASIQKTAFTTSNGPYEFLRTPFGMRNAPSQFSRLMQIIFGKYNFITLYLDDIIIHSTSFEQHVSHVKTTIGILIKHKRKLKKQKCKWFSKEIKLLGHIVLGGSVKMDPIKIQAIVNRQPPTNKKQVQEFLGLPNYYRKIIFNFSEIARPISNLLKKDVVLCGLTNAFKLSIN
jgi:hypothetical protein